MLNNLSIAGFQVEPALAAVLILAMFSLRTVRQLHLHRHYEADLREELRFLREELRNLKVELRKLRKF